MDYVVIGLCNIESFDIVSPRGHRPTKLRFCRFLAVPSLPDQTVSKPFWICFIIILAVFASEVSRIWIKSSKFAHKYCNFENDVFQSPQHNDYRCATTVHTKQPLLLMFPISAKRFYDFSYQLGSIAPICKSGHFASEMLRFSNYVVFRRSNNSVF